MDEIRSFNGDHAFLSNFAPSDFYYAAIPYSTVEHFFQSMKTTDPHQRKVIAAAASPYRAKQLGGRIMLRRDWEAVKLQVMRKGLELKFRADSVLAERLLSTGAALLVEGNTWGDHYWGVCNGRGSNWLGHLLMARRAELAAGRGTVS